MDDHVLALLEFDRITRFLSTFCETPVGRALAEALRPGSDRERITVALERTSEVVRWLDEGGRVPLAGVRDVEVVLDSLHGRGRPIDEDEILGFLSTLETAKALGEAVRARAELAPRCAELASSMHDFEGLLARFELTVDARGKIRDEASPRLAEIRGRMRGVEDEIEERLRVLLSSSSIRSVLREAKSFYRNGRFVLPVKAESRGHVRGLIHDSSQSGNTVFVEPEETIEAGNRLADLRTRERQEISRILIALTRDILDVEVELRATVRIVGEMDLVYAKARYAAEHDLRPAGFDDRAIVLREARHPLLLVYGASDENGSKVVPMDLRLGDDFDLLVVTGPNTGGKTVALKCVGLVCLMHQSGMHVPVADGSRLPVFDHIGADIGDEQSLQQSLSTFSAHMRNITAILRAAGPRSLVLLDELGAGTDPVEGAALGVGILEALRERGCRAVVTTHIGSLKEYAYRHARAANASVEFDVETLSPTYRLLLGQPGRSNALTIAKGMGMPEEVLRRAAAEVEEPPDESRRLIDELQAKLQETERRLEEAEAARVEASAARSDAESLRDEVDRRGRMLSEEADQVVDARFRALRSALEPILATLAGGPAPIREAGTRLEEVLDEEIRSTPLGRRREDYIRKLKKEEWVTVPKYRQKGKVKRIRRDCRIVSVQIGAMLLEVPYEEIAVPGDVES